MKKIYWILIAAALIAVVAAPGVALANNGPHGSYIMNTDACAGCHRAHTAPSSITWVDSKDQVKSALLLSDTSQVYLFCLACHDSTSQGADTNVLDGVYEGNAYGTQNAAMISGAFGREDNVGGVPGLYDGAGHRVTSTHTMNGQSWGAWGGGSFGATKTIDATGNFPSLLGTGDKIVMDCGSCHDPHGSSNYRILKDVVNGVTVGGYTGADPQNLQPNAWVLSSEKNFPDNGFLLHVPAAGYEPNYTVAQYSKGPEGADQTKKGMVGWCISCHTVYASTESTYNAGDGFGFVNRHRHPMNVSLDTYFGPRPLTAPSALSATATPLAHDFGETVNSDTDFIECLTCHNAHGASTVMTGFANVANQLDPVPDSGATFGGGVDPTTDSALLKMDNRGVCEACHNK